MHFSNISNPQNTFYTGIMQFHFLLQNYMTLHASTKLPPTTKIKISDPPHSKDFSGIFNNPVLQLERVEGGCMPC